MPKLSGLSGADRYNFMMALTGYLINHRQQKIEDVATHFQVTEKEIRSAVVTISLSGVGLYRPDELFFLDYDLLEEGIVDLSFAPTLDQVPRLSTRQAAALASGLSYLLEVVGDSDKEDIYELLGVLGAGAKGHRDLPFMVQPRSTDSDLNLVRQAVAEQRMIGCSYINASGELSTRKIEPSTLESRDLVWYLHGFCLTNSQMRVFRLDRMRSIEVLQPFAGRELAEINNIYSPSDDDTEVLFEVEPEAFSLIADYKPDFEILENKTVQVKIPIGQLSNLGRIVARYSGAVRVLGPEPARRAVLDFIHRASGARPAEIEAE